MPKTQIFGWCWAGDERWGDCSYGPRPADILWSLYNYTIAAPNPYSNYEGPYITLMGANIMRPGIGNPPPTAVRRALVVALRYLSVMPKP